MGPRTSRGAARGPTRRSAPAILGALLLLTPFSLFSCRGRVPPAVTAEASPFAAADKLLDAGRFEEAASEYLRLKQEFARRKDGAGKWRATLWWCRAARDIGKTDEALAQIPALLAFAAGNPGREGWTRCVHALLLHRAGKMDDALGEASRALELSGPARDPRLESKALGVIGTVHSLTGRYRQALAANERRLVIERRLANAPRELVTALNSVAIDDRHLGRYAEAVQLYDEAIAFEKRADVGEDALAQSLYNLSNVWMATGDSRRALGLKLESLRHAEKTGNVYGLVLLHGDIAEVYRGSGNLTAARPHAETAVAMARKAGQPYGQASALEHLGRLELEAGNLAAARPPLAEAIEIADRSKYAHQQVMARVVSARVEIAAGDPREALRRADEAVALAQPMDDPEVEFEALSARAEALEASKDPSAADAYEKAIDLLESWRGRLAMGDLRMGIQEPRLSAYEGAIRVLLARGEAAAAFEQAERARARLLLDIMADREAKKAASVRRGLRQELLELSDIQAKARPEARAALAPRIASAVSRIEAFEAEERRLLPAAAAARYPKSESSEAIRSAFESPGRALLSYFWGERDVYAWWLDARGVRGARLGSSAALVPLVEFLRASADDPVSQADWRAAARRAYRELVAPVSPSSTGDVSVVPDGPLLYVPFEVMIPAGSDLPWGATRVVGYSPSASVLLALHRAGHPGRFPRAMLAVGGPRFSGASAPTLVRGSEVPTAPLPYSAEEARSVWRIFEEEGAELLVGRSATAEGWLREHPERYRYLHFATHALVSDRLPSQTCLVLAGSRLDLDAIRRLTLQTALVSLSACQTALGTSVRGEGVIGLPHAFLGAGARSVLVTLWRIDDRSAAEFMRRFYERLHVDRNAGRALLGVRREWIARSPEESRPFRWAPFVLVGDPGD
ncbi:MAG: CHAT domain-containing protein [Acidobacteriota bacterium]|nr:CHAT domain-containing protein [Acidobacteriota bacterium]